MNPSSGATATAASNTGSRSDMQTAASNGPRSKAATSTASSEKGDAANYTATRPTSATPTRTTPVRTIPTQTFQRSSGDSQATNAGGPADAQSGEESGSNQSGEAAVVSAASNTPSARSSVTPGDDRATKIANLNEEAKALVPVNSPAPSASNRSLELPIEQIETNPFQPRREFNESEIASLAESLRDHEQLQPILVRRVGETYQLISGERRLRAAKHAGLKTIRADIREADDRLVSELAIIENLQRKDLSAVEKALSFRRYIEEHRCTQDDLAKRLKIDRSTVANMMRMLELPQPILDAVQSHAISAGHARALLPLNEVDEQLDFAKRIEAEGWSVRMAEREVSETIKAQDAAENGTAGPARSATQPSKMPKSEHVVALEQDLKMALGSKVEIKSGARGRGKITIHFSNSIEFERLRDALAQTGAAKKAA
jgi:ParB family chromosome partitioning protein